MNRQEITVELSAIFKDYLKDKGVDLVDFIYRYEGRNLFLRILVDRPEGGITLEECAEFNRQISGILDERGILKERYILEVSSPGLDRPLKQKNDFLRCLNRKARFFLNEPVNGKIELQGVIEKVEGDAVYIGIDKEALKIPLAKINKAKQVI